MRIVIIKTDVYDGSVFLQGTELDVNAELAQALIVNGIAQARDQDEVVFTAVANDTADPNEE